MACTPYNCNLAGAEALPASVNFSPEMRKLQTILSDLVTSLSTSLSKSNPECRPSKSISKKLQDLSGLIRPLEYKVAVFGEMGTGKSCTINSLLGVGMIARSGSNGGSCTWVTHTYSKPFEGQLGRFAVIVRFQTHEQIEQLCRELLTRCHLEQDDDQATRESDVATAQEHDLNTVATLLQSAFCDHEEFSSNAAAKQYLKARKVSFQTKLDQLLRWAVQLVERHSEWSENADFEGGLGAYHECEKVEDLQIWVQPYSHHTKAHAKSKIPDPCLFVHRIDYGLSTKLTDNHITLVDAPGLNDCHPHRRRLGVEAIRDASHAMIVTPSIRALSDPQVRVHMKYAVEHVGIEKTMLVLTHLDALRGEDDETEATAKSTSASVADLRRELMEAYSCENLAIFAVSNTIYQDYVKGATGRSSHLTIELTGIPMLRSYLLALPARQMFLHLSTAAEVNLPDVLNSIALMHIKMRVPDTCQITKVLDEVQHLTRNLTITQDLSEAVGSDLLTRLHFHIPAWSAATLDTVEQWYATHSTPEHLQIMRQGGNKTWVRRTVHCHLPLRVDWSDDIVSIGRNVVNNIFSELYGIVRTLLQGVSEMVTRRLRAMCSDIQSQMHPILRQATLGDQTAFDRQMQRLRTCINALSQVTDSARAYLITRLERIRQRCVLSIEDGFINEQVRATCETACHLLGRWRYQQRQIELEAMSQRIWPILCQQVDQASTEAILAVVKDMMSSFAERLQGIEECCDFFREHTRVHQVQMNVQLAEELQEHHEFYKDKRAYEIRTLLRKCAAIEEAYVALPQV